MKRIVSRSDPDLDPFRFGWRYVPQVGADDRKRWVQVPLSLDDALHPHKGGHICKRNRGSFSVVKECACVIEAGSAIAGQAR